jgi:iron complex transport system ATP-binding protein
MILKAHDLTVGYGSHAVGSGFNVAISGGEVLALLGPNGGGKTTLLKTLLGLLPPLKGEIRLAGATLTKLSVRERARHVAYVPQVHGGLFAFSVEELVLMGRSAHTPLLAAPSQHDREIARATIERLGIRHLAGKPYTQISGGERQLALVARALAQEPRRVIFDEPTASPDFGNQGKIMREVRRLAADGLGVIFSTHDPNQALRHADRALLLRDGRTLSLGRAREVVTQDNLRALYGAEILKIGTDGETAYLPG